MFIPTTTPQNCSYIQGSPNVCQRAQVYVLLQFSSFDAIICIATADRRDILASHLTQATSSAETEVYVYQIT